MTTISVLHAPNHYMVKRYWLDEEQGSLQKQDYDRATYFKAEGVEVNGIHELSRLLSNLESDSHRFIVRGLLADDVDTSTVIRRRMRRGDGGIGNPNEYPFLDEPQPWAMIDVDKLPLPQSIDLLQQPEEAVRYVISQLPEEFHDVDVHWQLSSSAGLSPDDHVISVHLCYWLDKPVSNEMLRRWARAVDFQHSRRLVDPALFNPVQPHYTASPTFGKGIDDPFVGNRSGFLSWQQGDVVSIDLSILKSSSAHSSVSHKHHMIQSDVRGFENILATMGDHEGGSGFYDPLLRSTASYVGRVGGDRASDEREALKEFLRHKIDQANQTNHSVGEIDHYTSDSFLDGLIRGAIEKFGDRSQLPPYFDTKALTLEQGEQELERAIIDFAHQVTAYWDSDLITDPLPVLGIKATAGLGKTSQIIKKLISESVLKRGDVQYYVPNHRLSKELVEDLEEELDVHLPDGSIYKRVQLIAGRGHKDENGRALCWKNDLAQKLAVLGENVTSSLCSSEEEVCEYYDHCGYQAQFEDEDLEIPRDDKLSELFPAVTVLAHAHLFLNTKDRLMDPSLVVVDEAFYQGGYWVEKAKPTELYRSNKPISTFIFELLMNGEKELLGEIRNRGYEADDLIREAKEIEKEDRESNKGDVGWRGVISPSMSEQEQRRVLNYKVQKRKAPLVLRQLAGEMKSSDVRAISHAVYYDDISDQVLIHGRNELTISSLVPTIFIDADLEPEILSQFTDEDTDITEIPVERKAEIHQFTDQTFSITKLLNSGQKSEELLGQVKEFIDQTAAKGSTLVACSKKVRRALTGEEGIEGLLPQEGLCNGATVIHFGNLRGLNEYSGYENVIILGREQPPANAIEDIARGLWWDEREVPLSFLEEKRGGNKPLMNEWRGYRAANEGNKSVSVQVYPDHRIQLLLEQIRECESVQAIDRLRLLRPNKEGKDRKVFILSSVPLDVTVDHFWSWEGIQKLLKLWREAEGVLPLNAVHMAQRCPESSGSERTAKRRGKDLKSAIPLIYILIREVALYSVFYRSLGQKKPFEAIVSGEISDSERDKVLSGLIEGQFEVVGVKKCS